MKKIIFILAVIPLFFHCKDENRADLGQSKMPLSDDHAAELYTRYKANPASQAELDENILIDYAVDNRLMVQRTKTGLYYAIIKEGSGSNYTYNEKFRIHYTGYFPDGKVFDSSYQRNKPLKARVGEMIPGWNEALLLMNKGTRAKLLIPSHLAYGKEGLPGLIPSDACLIFDIELLD